MLARVNITNHINEGEIWSILNSHSIIKIKGKQKVQIVYKKKNKKLFDVSIDIQLFFIEDEKKSPTICSCNN